MLRLARLIIMLHLQRPSSKAASRLSSGEGDQLLPPHSFLDPFSPELWASLAAAYVLTSLTLFFVARVSPYERRAAPLRGEATGLCLGGDGFSLCNAFWYTFAGFCMRGSNIAANVSNQLGVLLKPHTVRYDRRIPRKCNRSTPGDYSVNQFRSSLIGAR